MQEIIIPVTLDEKTFRRFARFDMLRLRKKWVRPTVFAALLLAFGTVALLTRKRQSGMIAAVLYAIGLGLPLVYFGMFLSQVNMQAARLGLEKGRRVYTVRLSREGLRVENDIKKEETLTLPWKDIPQAFFAKGCIYLYAAPTRAFLLPDGQGNADQKTIWTELIRHMGDAKCKML